MDIKKEIISVIDFFESINGTFFGIHLNLLAIGCLDYDCLTSL